MFSYLYPKLPSDKVIAVAVYTCLLTSMVVTALKRSGKTSVKSYYSLAFGALLFAISDSVLSLVIFDGLSGKNSGFIVMFTYYIG